MHLQIQVLQVNLKVYIARIILIKNNVFTFDAISGYVKLSKLIVYSPAKPGFGDSMSFELLLEEIASNVKTMQRAFAPCKTSWKKSP